MSSLIHEITWSLEKQTFRLTHPVMVVHESGEQIGYIEAGTILEVEVPRDIKVDYGGQDEL